MATLPNSPPSASARRLIEAVDADEDCCEDIVYEDDFESEDQVDDGGPEQVSSDSDDDNNDIEPDSLAEDFEKVLGSEKNMPNVEKEGSEPGSSEDEDTVRLSGEEGAEDSEEDVKGDHEIENVFYTDANCNPISSPAAVIAACSPEPTDTDPNKSSSRAESIMSRSSVSYFVDLNTPEVSPRSTTDTSLTTENSNPVAARRHISNRLMSKSMFVPSSGSSVETADPEDGDSAGTGVSFFVEIFKDAAAVTPSTLASAPVPAKSTPVPHKLQYQQVSHRTEKKRTKVRGSVPPAATSGSEMKTALIQRATERLQLVMSGPTFSKAEVRRKKTAATRLETLLVEEEARLKRGEEISSPNVVDLVLLGGETGVAGGAEAKSQQQSTVDANGKVRPVSAYQQQRMNKEKQGKIQGKRRQVIKMQSMESKSILE